MRETLPQATLITSKRGARCYVNYELVALVMCTYRGPPLHRLVLQTIARFCDAKGETFVGLATLAEETGLTKSGVRAIRDRLITEGEVSRIGHPTRTRKTPLFALTNRVAQRGSSAQIRVTNRVAQRGTTAMPIALNKEGNKEGNREDAPTERKDARLRPSACGGVPLREKPQSGSAPLPDRRRRAKTFAELDEMRQRNDADLPRLRAMARAVRL